MTTEALHDMTDRELYRLGFEVSEVLVERAQIRLAAEVEAEDFVPDDNKYLYSRKVIA